MATPFKSLLQKTTLIHPTDIEDKSCPVCLDPYLHPSSKEFPRRLPCGHILGTECLLIYAAGQANTEEGVKCPWCRRVVVDGVGGGDEEGVGVALGFIDEAGVVDELGFGETACVILLAHGLMTLAAYHLSLHYHYLQPLALLMLGSWLQAVCAGGALVLGIHHRIDMRPLRRFFGALLVLIGLAVGMMGGNRFLAHALLELGKVPFEEVLVRLYEAHRGKVLLGAGAVVVAVSAAGGEVPGREMIVMEAVRHGFACLGYRAILRVVR